MFLYNKKGKIDSIRQLKLDNNSFCEAFIQNRLNNYKIHIAFILLLLIDIILLMFMIKETSIYYKEARGFFLNNQVQFYIANIGVDIIQFFFHNPLLNDYGLRLPFVLIHIINCVLIYKIGLCILNKTLDSLFCVMLYMSIPGVSIEALIVSHVGIITLICLVIIYHQIKYNKIRYELFIIISFFDSGGSILCLALFFYALLSRKNNILILFSIVCFGVNMFIFSPIHGIPQSYFIDTMGLMIIIFTPALLIYYLASVYSYTFLKTSTLLNLIPFVCFIFVMLLSTRQKIDIESFLPQLSVGIPFFMQKMLFDIRSRLPQFRMRYILRLSIIIVLLLFGNILLFGNKIIYLFSEQQHNFAYSFYEAKDIAKELYKKDITNIEIPNSDLELRLKFYGINYAQKKHPKYRLQTSSNGDIKIIYFGKIVAQYDIIRIK